MLTIVSPHIDPIMHAWLSLEIPLGIHRTPKHAPKPPKQVLPSPTKRKPWLYLKDFRVFGLGNVRTHASEENTDSVY